jgi:hypothetical protein
MRDAALAERGEKQHVVFTDVRAEGPAVAEYDGLSTSPTLVIDVSSILFVVIVLIGRLLIEGQSGMCPSVCREII